MAEETLRLENIVKDFHMGDIVVNALRGVSLTVRKNEFVALMGPSGSGKSTLMNIIGCLDTPTSGRYFINGKDVSNISDDDLADIRNNEIGFIFQTFNLLPRSTALENVMLPQIYAGVPKSERIKNAKETLAKVGLADRMEHHPSELSGGQKQRVATARALINNPSIILADEPTGALDTKTSLEIMKLLEEIHDAGNTVVIITHEEDIALHAHRIIRLVDGQIVSDEPNKNIIK
ncbi:MAG: ABC transporter ATP-binding protein [Bacteroidales bacterium]|nr:ABC transporter ATP-binding protein [Bacteroidales bacterium]